MVAGLSVALARFQALENELGSKRDTDLKVCTAGRALPPSLRIVRIVCKKA